MNPVFFAHDSQIDPPKISKYSYPTHRAKFQQCRPTFWSNESGRIWPCLWWLVGPVLFARLSPIYQFEDHTIAWNLDSYPTIRTSDKFILISCTCYISPTNYLWLVFVSLFTTWRGGTPCNVAFRLNCMISKLCGLWADWDRGRGCEAGGKKSSIALSMRMRCEDLHTITYSAVTRYLLQRGYLLIYIICNISLIY